MFSIWVIILINIAVGCPECLNGEFCIQETGSCHASCNDTINGEIFLINGTNITVCPGSYEYDSGYMCVNNVECTYYFYKTETKLLIDSKDVNAYVITTIVLCICLFISCIGILVLCLIIKRKLIKKTEEYDSLCQNNNSMPDAIGALSTYYPEDEVIIVPSIITTI